MIETIAVKKRDVKGSRAMIKIRESGSIPAILYGHGEENVCLTVSLDTVNNLIKHGTKLVTLSGDINDTALLRAVQWSSMGDYIIHVDFARVSQTETVEVSIPIHLHGEAPGAMSSAGQLKLPEGASAVTPGSIVIVQVATQSGAEGAEAAASPSEPELIRKEKAADTGA